MAATSSIEWTRSDDGTAGKTWNPVIGCRRVSPGCERCYAETMAGRIARMGGRAAERYLRVVKLDESGKGRGRWNGRFEFVPGALAAPLQWRKPCRVFVNSMSDLFGEGVTDEQIAAVFGVMAACPQHTFQVLTKRPERMVKWFRWIAASPVSLGGPTVNAARGARWHAWHHIDELRVHDPEQPWIWPLPNVWIGVSVEDQQRADERVPLLLQVPAAVRFLSVEPLLEEVDLRRYLRPVLPGDPPHWRRSVTTPSGPRDGIDWTIVGTESGPGARRIPIEPVKSIVDQCTAAGVAVFVKQIWSEAAQKAGDPKGGDMAHWPEWAKRREFPEVTS